MPIEILNNQVIHTQDNLTYSMKKVRLPNNTVVERMILEHPGAVAIVPLTDNGQVILVRQYRLGVNDYLLEIPAGGREPGEDPRTCAERELQEETGYFPETLTELGGFYSLPGISNEYLHLYLARDLRPSRLEMDEDEIIEVVKMPLAKAIESISTHEIRDAKTILGLFMLRQREQD